MGEAKNIYSRQIPDTLKNFTLGWKHGRLQTLKNSYLVFLLVLLLDGLVHIFRLRISDDLTVLDEVTQLFALSG